MNAIDIEKLNQLISRTDISGNDKVKRITDFIDGKELQQQERSYSEEEVIELLYKREDCINQTSSIYDYTSAKDWFEQFKKK